jgi:hypothetical protein
MSIEQHIEKQIALDQDLWLSNRISDRIFEQHVSCQAFSFVAQCSNILSK